ncbi:hypothetical protein ANN_26409 [Periplaneta americana]|uniref:ABC transporter domain-containing protein n=1 Tax=Periplaneta americana TaxID=6978 RepID=A0ABQ8RY02_PERAM|nr:hypothetical protein ANN_26409 [Periplaneta americana]
MTFIFSVIALQKHVAELQDTITGVGAGETQIDGVINQTNEPPVTGLGFDPVETNPNMCQTLVALLRLRILRMFRDIQKLYFMIVLPLGFAALGLYVHSIQSTDPKMKSLVLNAGQGPMAGLCEGSSEPPGSLKAKTYKTHTKLAFHNATSTSLDDFVMALEESGSSSVDLYNGNFSLLLDLSPHMAALNVNIWEMPEISITTIYNDTAQHSLPIVINVLSNAFYRMLVHKKKFDHEPIIVKTHPFQQTSQPEEFNMGTFSSAIFLGMIFVLVPVSLAVDMVYDREIKAKNQLRVNGLSFFMYFFTYFVVLAALMLFICIALLILIFVFDLPSLREPPAFCTMGTLIVLYCPASILFATCVSYIFDKMDSAQSILPNIATFLGLIPFLLVMFLDMLRIGGRAALALHVVFSLLNTMYLPYAIVYFVDRVHLMCRVNLACTNLTLADYLTDEIIVMLVGILLHIPIWFFVLLILDIKKSGGRASDVFKHFLRNPENVTEDVVENNDVGEHEDDDVRTERQKVADILSNKSANPPVVVVQPIIDLLPSHDVFIVMVPQYSSSNPTFSCPQNLRKEYQKLMMKVCCGGTDGSCCCMKGDDDHDTHTKVAVRNLSLAVDAGEVFGLLGHNGAGKTTTMKIMIAEEAATKGRVQIGGHNVTSNIAEAFQLMGYCPQHDAQWKNITVREHLECYAAIRGVPSSEINRVVDLYLAGLQIQEHAGKQSQHCSGGTRRKLSFAMAMVGGPCVVLMDEPSTGMDPRSKRFLWDTILASFQETLRGHSDSSFRGEGYIQCCVGVRLCDMYSNQELAEIHFMYGKADGNAALARHLYQERYPQRQYPDRKTFVHLHYSLCEYGKFNSPGLGRGRPRSTTPEVQEEILEAVNMTPSISTRRVALQVNVPHTTVWRLLKEYQLYPYHLQRVQALSPADYPTRVRFCQWFLQQCGVNPNFPALVLFTDEAQFTRDGITNFHNQHVWAYENPRATVPSHHQGTRGAILTTHSMEEADALCSRVGIMVKGELRCIGSTQHLKNLYGAGYTLEMKLRGGDRTPTTPSSDRHSDLKEFVAGLFPDATLEESFADRLMFSVPQHAVTSLAECFSQLEKAKSELDIEEYSFSQTTLEQVFLKFAHYDEVNGD